MPKSFYDIISNKTIAPLRTFYNKKLNIISTEAQILKINLSDDWDSYGQRDEFIKGNIIDNVVLNFDSMDGLELFLTKDVEGKTKVAGVSLGDILPVEMIIPWDVQNLFEEDIITTVFLDETDRKMPVVWQITDIKGSYRNRHLVKKTATLSLYRETMSSEMKLILDMYVNEFIV